MLVHWIWLATRPGLNDRGKLAVLRHFSTAENAYLADVNACGGIDGISPKALDGLRDKSLTRARQILDQCTRDNIRVLTWQDGAYPARLKNIYDPPLVLYYKGCLPDLNELPVIGVVGTRNATSYGIASARRISYQITRCGGVVVSGMAAGIDAAAAEGALRAEGITIGVLGGGVDIVYPRSNLPLFQRMERKGCLLSEYPPGTRPAKWSFPQRNRIISGLSSGVLVVEAPESSGALITARQAREQGRDLFSVPGNIDLETFKGSNALLADGAKAVVTGWDVLSEYQEQYPERLQRVTELPQLDWASEEWTESEPNLPVLEESSGAAAPKNKKIIDNSPAPPYIDGEKSLPDLTDEERAVVDQLRRGPQPADDVIAAAGLSSGKVLGVLTLLEVRGVIRRLPGNLIVLQEF